MEYFLGLFKLFINIYYWGIIDAQYYIQVSGVQLASHNF